MMKVEAVVVRDRVETVMEAVEAATGHVGVTVIEAVGHGREKGITHEYRGRVFESRFLPKALHDVHRPRRSRGGRHRRDRRRGAHRSRKRRRDLLDVARGVRHPQPDRSTAGGGRDGMSTKELDIRGQHDLGDLRGDARDLHAGGLRVPRGGPHPDEERRPHRGQERPHPRRSRRSSTTASASGWRSATEAPASSAARASSRRSTSCSRSGSRRSRGSARSPAQRAICSRWRSPPSRSRSSGARWPSAPSCGSTSRSAPLFTLIYSLVSHWVWSPDGLALRKGMQDFAGSTVVHYQGALAGLAGALLLGPRLGKFGADGKPNADSRATTWRSRRSA